MQVVGPNLGGTPPKGAERDAVHIAVIAVEAGEKLQKGQDVWLIDGKAVSGRPETLQFPWERVGVVDPFRWGEVEKGDRFWLVLEPGTITALRHEWAHPFFPAPDVPATAPTDADRSRQYLEEGCRKYGITYQELVEGAVSGQGGTFMGDWADNGRDWIAGGDFWHHIENVTGRRFDQGHRENTYFGCSC